MSNENFNKFKKIMSGKGYYIALILCAVAIGISGYLYYRNADSSEPQLHTPGQTEAVGPGPEDTLPVIATHPQQLEESKPQSPKLLKTAAPLEGETLADYAMETLSYNETTRDWRVHNGMDIAAEAGAKVRAAADGEVYTVYQDEKLGTTVVIRHAEGYVTKYASLGEEVLVKPGDKVKLGQAIGTVGKTALLECALGDHVHFSVTCNDDPVDPEKFLSLGK